MGKKLAKLIRGPVPIERERDRFFATLGKQTYCLTPHDYKASLDLAIERWAEFEAEQRAQVVKLGERGPMFLREDHG